MPVDSHCGLQDYPPRVRWTNWSFNSSLCPDRTSRQPGSLLMSPARFPPGIPVASPTTSAANSRPRSTSMWKVMSLQSARLRRQQRIAWEHPQPSRLACSSRPPQARRSRECGLFFQPGTPPRPWWATKHMLTFVAQALSLPRRYFCRRLARVSLNPVLAPESRREAAASVARQLC